MFPSYSSSDEEKAGMEQPRHTPRLACKDNRAGHPGIYQTEKQATEDSGGTTDGTAPTLTINLVRPFTRTQ